MADWSWKQAVAECVLDIVNRIDASHFDLSEVYEYEPDLSKRFPRNRHVRAKIRQTLQKLSDEDFLSFEAPGQYALNLAHEQVAIDESSLARLGTERPDSRHVSRIVRLRSTFLAAEVKRRYRHVCQVCREPVPLGVDRNYAEAHHLKPLGFPHLGPDLAGNIIVPCPNHHVMFDRGVVMIDPGTLHIQHVVSDAIPTGMCLHLEPWHKIKRCYLVYHCSKIFTEAC
jgi:hypothetical protein